MRYALYRIHMARILIIGPTAFADEFASIIDGAHDVATVDDGDVSGLANVDGVAFDAVFDIAVREHSEALDMSGRRSVLAAATHAFVNGSTVTATAVARALGSPAVFTISALPTVTRTAQHIELAAALQTGHSERAGAAAVLTEYTGRPVELVEDRVGMISSRVLAMVVNEAAFAVMERVATPEDIDTAMKLGTSYPHGPLAWADAIGHENIVSILDALYHEYREERYRACVLLRQHARAGKRFTDA